MDELHTLHSFIKDFWQLMKTNLHVEDPEDDYYWAELTTKVSAMAKKYDNHPAVVQTLCGYLDYLEIEGCGRDREELRRKKWTN